MITSKDNEKLKLIRRLAAAKHREREGLFVTEGEDLLAAGRFAGAEPALLLSADGACPEGEQVERKLLDGVSALGSGSRVIAAWPLRWAEAAAGPLCVYLHGVGDPGNVGSVIRSVDALVGGSVALGPGSADPFSAKAVRASMGSIFSTSIVRCAFEQTPSPRVALVAHGGEAVTALGLPVTLCLGAERKGLPAEIESVCDSRWTIPLRDTAVESLNVAAAAAIACERISSAAGESGTL